MRRSIFLLFSLTVAVLQVFAQQDKPWQASDLRPVRSFEKQCGQYEQVVRKVPKESRFGLFLRGNHLYFQANDSRLFAAIFQHKWDGIAIDIVSRDQMLCDQAPLVRQQDQFLGESWKILFYEDLAMMENLSVNPNKVVLDLGVLPDDFDEKSQECNLAILQKRSICDYQKFLNIDPQYWQLLDMGLFKDSVSVERTGDVVALNEKVLEFSIQYKKNEATISKRDIQTIHDSLNFTDYDIASINIVAFTSVEGGRQLNEQLMKRRSKSVVDALQQYQKPEIIYQVDALENWDQFYRDIRRTRYRDMADMEKGAVKKLLAGNESTLSKLEPLLARHRKAVLKIFMTRKIKIESLSNQELVSVFNTAVKKEDVNRVILLLDYIFERAKDADDPRKLTSQLKIPKAIRYNPLLNNLAGFEYGTALSTSDETEEAYEELHELFPDNGQILYNLVAVRLTKLQKSVNKQDMQALRDLMNELQISKLPPSLKYRPWINYYILTNEYYRQINDFASSRRAIGNILSIYKNVLTDRDRLSIARYLATYYQYEQAEKIMQPVLTNKDVPDDLIFFYLNITLPFRKYYSKSYFDALIDKAVSIDRDRFCHFFRSRNDEGISFQLLQSPRLQEVYCETCR